MKVLILFCLASVTAWANNDESCSLVLNKHSIFYFHFIEHQREVSTRIVSLKNKKRESPEQINVREFSPESIWGERLSYNLSLHRKRDNRSKIAELRAGDVITGLEGTRHTLEEFLSYDEHAHYWQTSEHPRDTLRLPFAVDNLFSVFRGPLEKGQRNSQRYLREMTQAKSLDLPVADVTNRDGLLYIRGDNRSQSLLHLLRSMSSFQKVKNKVQFEAFKDFLISLTGNHGLYGLTTKDVMWDPQRQIWLIADFTAISRYRAKERKLHMAYRTLARSMSQSFVGEVFWAEAIREIGSPGFTLF